MRRRMVLACALLFVIIVGTACSGNISQSSEKESPSNQPQATQEAEAQVTKKNPESTNWEVTSKAHYIKGEITDLNQTAGYADVITMKIKANYRSDNDPSDSPPFRTEEVVKFKLLTVVNLSEHILTNGTQVILNTSQFTSKNEETPFWAGDIIGYEKEGIYYDLGGKPANFTMSKQASLNEGKLTEPQ